MTIIRRNRTMNRPKVFRHVSEVISAGVSFSSITILSSGSPFEFSLRVKSLKG